MVDHFSKWAEAFPIRNQEATTVARVLVKEFISRYGCPKQILTDQGPCFEAVLFQELCRLLRIDKVRTSPYKPSTNGIVERFHRTLNAMIGKVVADNQRDWDTHLPFVLAAYRASEHESTGFTPNRLFLSRELCLPIDLVLGDFQTMSEHDNVNEFVLSQSVRMQADFRIAREFLQRQATVRALKYNLRVKEAAFLPGQLVWYFYPRKRAGLKEKWTKLYTGPYRVEAQLSPVLYRIRKSPKSQAKLVYVDKLKLVEGDPRTFGEETAAPASYAPATEEIEGDEDVPTVRSRPSRCIKKPARFR